MYVLFVEAALVAVATIQAAVGYTRTGTIKPIRIERSSSLIHNTRTPPLRLRPGNLLYMSGSESSDGSNQNRRITPGGESSDGSSKGDADAYEGIEDIEELVERAKREQQEAKDEEKKAEAQKKKEVLKRRADKEYEAYWKRQNGA
jgi:hypothetical protein